MPISSAGSCSNRHRVFLVSLTIAYNSWRMWQKKRVARGVGEEHRGFWRWYWFSLGDGTKKVSKGAGAGADGNGGKGRV